MFRSNKFSRLILIPMILGFVAIGAVVLLLGLPSKMERGENGHKAIQELDAMRRPFLNMKRAEYRLVKMDVLPLDLHEFETAAESAKDRLARYLQSARYNPALFSKVVQLSEEYEAWLVSERLLFVQFGAHSKGTHGAATHKAFQEALALASSLFLSVMNTLGEGEIPIHDDIDRGRHAYHQFVASGAVFIAYLIGLLFVQQRWKAKQEAAHLKERLKMEEQAHDLERSLGNALAKVLSGFIRICANCKKVCDEDNKWRAVEVYVTKKTEAQFSHGICPPCAEQLYPDFVRQGKAHNEIDSGG